MSSTDFTPVIGLEIHVQLATKSKMFDRCSADWFGKEPNTVVGPLTLGMPGTLPVPNKKAIQWAILLGKALGCKTNKISKFDRKHYFYPDLPKGYQISQYDLPFSYEGEYIMQSNFSGKEKRIGITRVHLEEDTGKLIHKGSESLVDFNRAGVPLCEIVTEPDFDNTEDLKQFLEELQIIVRYLGISEADMEKGSMRLEPNISVRMPGEEGLPNYKVEVKNINSFRFAKAAADYEIKRHIHLLKKGETPVQETRGYDESKSITVSQRVKEEAADYRYFPEPDIPPFELSNEFLAEIDAMMVELPQERMIRYTKTGVAQADAYVITRSRSLSTMFEAVVEAVKKTNAELEFKSDSLEGEVAKMVVNKTISLSDSTDEIADLIIKKLTPIKVDTAALDQVISDVIASNPGPIADYHGGKEGAIMFLVGQVMGKMKGKADARIVKESIEVRIKND